MSDGAVRLADTSSSGHDQRQLHQYVKTPYVFY